MLFWLCFKKSRELVSVQAFGTFLQKVPAADRDVSLVYLSTLCFAKLFRCVLQTWQRPTLPCLKTKYHRR